MPIEIKYTGTQQRWPELSITGKQSVWMLGQIEERDDVEAGKLLATGLFKAEPVPLYAIPSSLEVGFSVVMDQRSIWDRAVRSIEALRDTSGVKFAILGDSILANPGTYAETQTIQSSNATWVTQAMHELAAQSPGFVPVSSAWSATYVQAPWTSGGGFGLGNFHVPNLQLKKSNNASVVLPTYSMPGPDLARQVCLYYLARTNNNAPRFTLSVNGAASVEIESYTPAVNFGTVLTNQSVPGIVKATTLAIPASRTVAATIGPLTMVDYGGGVGADGTIAIFGMDVGGGGIDHRNYAVASTTLLNNSAANAARGITTDERLQKAFDYGANAFLLGFASNDSKVGVSTPAAFEADYNLRIDQIRAYNTTAPIILFVPPRGAAGSIYENNAQYAEIVRKVAANRGLPFFDAMQIFDAAGPAAYADEVHPSAYGRNLLIRAFVSQCGGRVVQRAG